MNVWRQRRSARSSPSQRARISKSCARAFSVSIESKRGSRFLILTRSLNANRVHFAGKRSTPRFYPRSPRFSTLPRSSLFGRQGLLVEPHALAEGQREFDRQSRE